MPDDLNEVFVGLTNFIIFFYIIIYCEKISEKLNVNLNKRFYFFLALNPLFIAYSFSINKELIVCLVLLVFLIKILERGSFFSYLFLIIIGFIIRDGFGLSLLISIILLSFNINIIYFILTINFFAGYAIKENALLAYSGNDLYSIFNLNEAFIWMQSNFLYFFVVPIKFIVTVLSALPFRSGLPAHGSILGYFYLINSCLMLFLLLNIKKLMYFKFNLIYKKFLIFIYIYISIMLLPPFINQRYLISIYPLFFIIFLSNNEKNT